MKLSINNIEPYYPKKLYRLSFQKNFGIGKGRAFRKRAKYIPKAKFEEDSKNPRLFRGLIQMDPEELLYISKEIKEPNSTITALNWINKLYLVFQYMICNYKLASLVSIFGVSYSTVINIIDECLPLLIDYFNTYIPNELFSDICSSSILNKNIRMVIDATFHPTKKRKNSKLYFRKDKSGTFIQSIYLIDFDSNIIAYHVNVHGHLSDNVVPKHSKLFYNIANKNNSYAISDTGKLNFIFRFQ